MKIEIHPTNLALFKAEAALEDVESTGRVVHGAIQRSLDRISKTGVPRHDPDIMRLNGQWQVLRKRLPGLKVRVIQSMLDAEKIPDPTPFQL